MNNSWKIVPQVKSFQSYQAGLSIDEIKAKYNLEKVIKLASNENPFGVSPRVLQKINEEASSSFLYPQAGNPKLVQKLAKYFSEKYSSDNGNIEFKEEQIFVGNGSDEVIDLLFRVMVDPQKNNVVTFKPCFALYETQAKFLGCELRQAPLNDDFTFDFAKLLNLVDENTSLVFITSPDNPSGLLANKHEIIEFSKKIPQNCLLVIDEAYIEFAGDENETSLLGSLDKYPNIAIMRTFSKVYGLAGLRIGYAILPSMLADYLKRVRLPFSVNILAQEAAIIALEDEEFKQKTIENNRTERLRLINNLKELNCTVLNSHSNFIMFQLPDNKNIKEFCTKLLEKGLIIRHLAAYNLPNFARVSVGTKEQNDVFIKFSRDVLAVLN